MPIFRTKLKQLRDADVRFISLVDRAATRIPFRVLKREKENEMGIDLTRVFKSDGEAAKPYVSAVVVFAQENEDAAKQVLEAIEKHGFRTDRVQKADEGETLVFAQTDQPKDVQLVRLSDQALVSVANFQIPSGWLGDQIEEHGFFPDLKLATQGLYEEMLKVAKSDTPQDHAQAALTSYGEYLSQMITLPVEAFNLDETIVEIVKKCSCEEKKEPVVEEEPKGVKPEEAKKEEATKGEENPAKKSIAKESEADRKKRIKSHPPAEMAPVDEEDDQKPPPEEEAAKKGDVVDGATILAALNDLKATTTKQLTTLATKVESVVTEQSNQKKVLDDVVKKADTLGEKLGATVVAPVVSEDRPAGPARMRVQKEDDDPRRGNFDTAFIRRRH